MFKLFQKKQFIFASNFHMINNRNFKFSELGITEEQHAVKFKALVDNVDIVHHMILFQCKDDVNTTLPAYSCFDDMPRQCVALAIWAVGSKDFCKKFKN